MRQLKILAISLLLLAACKEASNVVADSEGRIPAKKLEQILHDIQLADVYSLSVREDTLHQFGQKNPDSLARYYQEIFQHHGVTYDQFDKTIAWYKEHPANFDTVYQNVLNKFSEEEAKLSNPAK
jgi:ParB-like chromosome segregation protein Spo0J